MKLRKFIDKNGKGEANFVGSVFALVLVSLVAGLAMIVWGILGSTTNLANAIQFVENNGYIVTPASFQSDITAIKAKTDNLPASPANEVTAAAAVVNANLAVVAAQNATVQAQIAAAKVDLFNSAPVYTFPVDTNITCTLTAGNTNTWGNWTEIKDSTNVTFTSKFPSSGYISDMCTFLHSDADDVYNIELAYGDGKIDLGRVRFYIPVGGKVSDLLPIKSRKVPAGEVIYYRMMCSGANGATTRVNFRYFYE